MRKLWIMIAALAAAAAVPGVANAIVCYTLLDRGDNVLYQDSLPPFDMSDSGAALRRGMRQRNEYLMIYEVDQCPPVVAVAGSTGYRPSTVEEIVGGMRTFATPSRGSSGTGRAVGGGVSAPPAAPASSRSGSTGVRSGY
ncbi:MAG TPA: hypothetical protein VGR42_03880 [Casimicrobiaceae bacterium]|jgi:hypothetical protein|nr:hypothetical protein [Casimicrobiaceae bacterium]